MSHFTVLVVGQNVKEQLAPFDENIEMPLYEDGILSESEKKDMMEYYAKHERTSFHSFEECYERFGEDWNDNMWKRDTEGVWHRYSTYNPNSKWDGYMIGGRWNNGLELKDGTRVNSALKRDIVNLDDISTFAILKDYKWYEKAKMGWWGFYIGEDKEWDEKFKKIIGDLPGDTLLTVVDCHI